MICPLAFYNQLLWAMLRHHLNSETAAKSQFDVVTKWRGGYADVAVASSTSANGDELPTTVVTTKRSYFVHHFRLIQRCCGSPIRGRTRLGPAQVNIHSLSPQLRSRSGRPLKNSPHHHCLVLLLEVLSSPSCRLADMSRLRKMMMRSKGVTFESSPHHWAAVMRLGRK